MPTLTERLEKQVGNQKNNMPIKVKNGFKVKETKIIKKTKKDALKVAKKIGVKY